MPNIRVLQWVSLFFRIFSDIDSLNQVNLILYSYSFHEKLLNKGLPKVWGRMECRIFQKEQRTFFALN